MTASNNSKPFDTDVVVVGASLDGTMLALRLAKRGKNVLLRSWFCLTSDLPSMWQRIGRVT